MASVMLAGAISIATAVSCEAVEFALQRDVIMRSEHSLVSIKRGTMVELVSRGDGTVTITYRGQTGMIPANGVPQAIPTPPPAAVPMGVETVVSETAASIPAAAHETPSIAIGSQRLFLENLVEAPAPLREYIPDGETLPHWHHKASVRVIKGQDDPVAYLKGVEAEAARERPSAPHRLAPDASTHELVLDYVAYPPETYAQRHPRWSLMKARRAEGGGLVVYEYSVRYSSFVEQTEMESEKAYMPLAFAKAIFDETTSAAKPHNIRLYVQADKSAEVAFPGNGRPVPFTPRFSLDFVGYIPQGFELDANVGDDGDTEFYRVSCSMMDPAGRYAGYMSSSVAPYKNTHMRPVKVTGEVRIHINRGMSPAFAIVSPGTYTLTVDCFLKDQQGKDYTLSASHDLTIVAAPPDPPNAVELFPVWPAAGTH